MVEGTCDDQYKHGNEVPDKSYNTKDEVEAYTTALLIKISDLCLNRSKKDTEHIIQSDDHVKRREGNQRHIVGITRCYI